MFLWECLVQDETGDFQSYFAIQKKLPDWTKIVGKKLDFPRLKGRKFAVKGEEGSYIIVRKNPFYVNGVKKWSMRSTESVCLSS